MIVRRGQASWMPSNFPKEGVSFDYKGAPQEISLERGAYLFELWGAQGGSESTGTGGKGAYVRGVLRIRESATFKIYVGQQGSKELNSFGWNGGGRRSNQGWYGNVSTSGGGATDIRLVGGAYDNLASLISRIMVAAGGGGGFFNYDLGATGWVKGGDGGSLSGIRQPKEYYGSGNQIHYNYSLNKPVATQTAAGIPDGKLGLGGNVVDAVYGIGCGGGGGYYGGSASPHLPPDFMGSGTGGSSFISGHEGCNALRDKDSVVHTGQPNHYSGLIFIQTQMIAGNQSMPNPRGVGNIVGNAGHGFARIRPAA